MLSPRAIALQGVGFSPLLLAVQGMWPDSAVLQPPVDTGGVGVGSGIRGIRRLRNVIREDDLAIDDLAIEHEELTEEVEIASLEVLAGKLQGVREAASAMSLQGEVEAARATFGALAMQAAKTKEQEEELALLMFAAMTMMDD